MVYSFPLFEFFDNGIPAGWTQIQYNGTNGLWTWTNDGSYFFGADENYVEANSEENNDLVFDVGLFTPVLDCSDLTFVTIDYYRNFQTAYSIGEASLRTYSGGIDPENFEEELWFQNGSDSFFGVHEVITFNPINYDDPSNVYVEFRYSTEGSTSGKFFKIDNVMIFDSNPGPSTVFFSEYIEGSGNNKALEIYNGSGDVIELDDYRIDQSANGGGWEFQHYFPVGVSLNAGDTWVIVTDEADTSMQAVADEILSYPSVVHFNGDDARGLEFNNSGETWIMIDVIGIPDEDPGTGWDVAGISNATSEHTLLRKPHTITGNTDWIESASTEERFSEWIVLPQNTFDFLGSFPNHIDDLWPPGFPEINLFGENNVLLDWEAPIPLESGWIYYHDDTLENGVSNGNAGSGLAVEFQPAVYPCTIELVRFYCDGEGGQSQDMEIWIIDDDFSTVLGGPYPLIVEPETWNTIDVEDIEISSGTFLVNTVAIEAYGPYIGRDDDTYEYGRTLWGNHNSGYTDVGAWGMNYIAGIEAFVIYEDFDRSQIQNTKIVKTQQSKYLNKAAYPLDEIIFSNAQRNVVLRNTRDFLGYNVYRNGELLNDGLINETEYYDLDLEFDTYEYNIIAVYDSGNSDPSAASCTIDIVDVDPFLLPYMEDWSSGDMSTNLWLPEPILYSFWYIGSSTGNPEPSLGYSWSSSTDYSQIINSHELNGNGLTSIIIQYDIAFNSASEVTLEEMNVEVYDGDNWNLIANHNNTNGDFGWISECYDISDFAVDNIFKVRFVAHGEDAYNINVWYIDNIFIGHSFLPPINLAMNEETGLFTWDAPVSGNLNGYDIYLNSVFLENVTETEFQFEDLNIDEDYTAGISAVYDDGISEVVYMEFTYIGTSVEDDVILKTKLIGNYPNPFNSSTTISFNLTTEHTENTEIVIYNIKGQEIRKYSIFNNQSSIVWDGKDDNRNSVSNGIYFYKIKSSRYTSTKKMILMK